MFDIQSVMWLIESNFQFLDLLSSAISTKMISLKLCNELNDGAFVVTELFILHMNFNSQ